MYCSNCGRTQCTCYCRGCGQVWMSCQGQCGRPPMFNEVQQQTSFGPPTIIRELNGAINWGLYSVSMFLMPLIAGLAVGEGIFATDNGGFPSQLRLLALAGGVWFGYCSFKMWRDFWRNRNN